MLYRKTYQRTCRNSLLLSVILSVVLCAGAVRAQNEIENLKAQAAPIIAAAELYKSVSAVQTNAATAFKTMADAGKTQADTRKVHAECRALELQNSLTQAKVHFDKRKMRNDYMSTVRRPPQTAAQSAHTAKVSVSARLTPTQLEGALRGELEWPAALRHERFEQERAELEKALKTLPVNKNGHRCPSQLQADNGLRRLAEKLKESADQFTGSETIAARTFLQALACEMRYPLRNSRELVAAK